jgi:deoxyguanosine kinase
MSMGPERNYVVVEGNIGSGKTTLAKLLAERWGTRLILERFSENPFLPKFYESPEKFAFPLELSFLAERYNQNRDELNHTDLFRPGVVADYSFSKSLIFARINLPDDEFELYQSLFHIIHGRLPRPDLLVYLHCSEEKSMRQIGIRGRHYEAGVNLSYLKRITQGYMDFLKQLTDTAVLLIDTDRLDFVQSPNDLKALIECIEVQYPVGVHPIVLGQ